MNISEDVNILNGLQVCRDKIEAKHYLKAHGICMNEHELDALRNHCYTENEENTLTANQLNKVAGGRPPFEIKHGSEHVGSPNPTGESLSKKENDLSVYRISPEVNALFTKNLRRRGMPDVRDYIDARFYYCARRTYSDGAILQESVREFRQDCQQVVRESEEKMEKAAKKAYEEIAERLENDGWKRPSSEQPPTGTQP